MVNFGEKIKKLRKEKKLTQKQLADLAGVAISAISAYESGNRYPSYEVLINTLTLEDIDFEKNKISVYKELHQWLHQKSL